MKLSAKYLLFFLLGIISYNSHCQNVYLDSLLRSLVKTTDKIKKTNALKNICYEYSYTNPDSAVYFGKKAVDESKTLNDTIKVSCIMTLAIAYNSQGNYRAALQNFQLALNECLRLQYNLGIAYCYSGIGNTYKNTGDNLKALEFHNKDLDFEKKINDTSGIAAAYGNIGTIYEYLGNYPKALDNQLMALKTSQSINENQTIGSSYNNIGNIYIKMNDYEKALEYQFKALSLYELEKDEYHSAFTLSNIGIVYQKKNNFPIALEYQQKSLDIRERLNDLSGMAISYGNLGELYESTGKYNESLLYHEKALKLNQKIGDKTGIINSLLSFANSFFKQNEFGRALEYSKKTLALALEIHNLDITKQAYELLSKCYDKTGNKDLAYQNYKNFIASRDSLYSNEKTKELTQKEMQFNFERQQDIEKAAQEKKDANAAAEKQKQKVITYSISTGLFLVLLFALFIFRSYRQKQKANIIITHQKAEVEKQKLLVDENQREIIASITYAKRLQQAILPSNEEIEKYLPDSFILYKPKDIVSGDFYWIAHPDPPEGRENQRTSHTTGDKWVSSPPLRGGREGLLFIAAADSTGHGVPGAIVSVVCSNALNRSVKEFHLTDTGKILDKTRELVLETFAKSGEEIKDGMDISLLRIEFASSPSGFISKGLQWSGANNPLWYFENKELKEIKADKQPIGKSDHPKPFTTHEIEYKPETTFYLFTDGFVDQFGTNGKKLMKKKFKEELFKIRPQPMIEQKEYLDNFFESWKGDLDQVDDVCVIGIRV